MWAWCFALAVGIAQLGWQQRHQVIEKLPQCSSCRRQGDCSGIPLAWDHQPRQSSWQIDFPGGFVNFGRTCGWGSRAYGTWDATISSCGRFCSSQFDHGCRLSIYHRNAQRLIEKWLLGQGAYMHLPSISSKSFRLPLPTLCISQKCRKTNSNIKQVTSWVKCQSKTFIFDGFKLKCMWL